MLIRLLSPPTHLLLLWDVHDEGSSLLRQGLLRRSGDFYLTPKLGLLDAGFPGFSCIVSSWIPDAQHVGVWLLNPGISFLSSQQMHHSRCPNPLYRLNQYHLTKFLLTLMKYPAITLTASVANITKSETHNFVPFFPHLGRWHTGRLPWHIP